MHASNGTPHPPLPADALPDDLIDLKEARRLMKCHLVTLYRWCETGRLRWWKRVGRRFVSRAECLALFTAGEPKEKPPRQPSPQRRATKAQKEWTESVLRRAGIV
jgi:hypothetical protein